MASNVVDFSRNVVRSDDKRPQKYEFHDPKIGETLLVYRPQDNFAYRCEVIDTDGSSVTARGEGPWGGKCVVARSKHGEPGGHEWFWAREVW